MCKEMRKAASLMSTILHYWPPPSHTNCLLRYMRRQDIVACSCYLEGYLRRANLGLMEAGALENDRRGRGQSVIVKVLPILLDAKTFKGQLSMNNLNLRFPLRLEMSDVALKQRRPHLSGGGDVGGLLIKEHGVLKCHATWQHVCEVEALPILKSHLGLHQ